MSGINLYVRVAPKSGNSQFYRCGLLFTLLWVLVIVDLATAERLKAEQMLETSEDEPEGYVPPGEVELVDADQEAADKAEQEAKAKAEQEAAEKAELAASAADNVVTMDAAKTKGKGK